MNKVNPKQSIRLKQISRLISRQKTEDEDVITSTCVSIVIILIVIFLTGLAMLVSGAVVVGSCSSWLPTWLVVEGSSLLAVCLVIFCSHSQTRLLSLLARLIFVLLILVNIWCSFGTDSHIKCITKTETTKSNVRHILDG